MDEGRWMRDQRKAWSSEFSKEALTNRWCIGRGLEWGAFESVREEAPAVVGLLHQASCSLANDADSDEHLRA